MNREQVKKAAGILNDLRLLDEAVQKAAMLHEPDGAWLRGSDGALGLIPLTKAELVNLIAQLKVEREAMLRKMEVT